MEDGRAPDCRKEDSECSGDSCKTAGSSGQQETQSGLAAVGEKLRRLHNGEPERVSSDEECVVEVSASKVGAQPEDNDDTEKESVDSEEELKLEVDVDVSSDEQVAHEREVIELSAGEDDDCEVLEIKPKVEKSDAQEGAAARENESAVEVVDIDDSGELDELQIDDKAEEEETGPEAVCAAVKEPGGGEETEERAVDHEESEVAVEEPSEAVVEGRLEDEQEEKAVDEGERSGLCDAVAGADVEDAPGARNDRAGAEAPRTVQPGARDDTCAEGDSSDTLSDPECFVGFEPSQPHSFEKESHQADGSEGELLGTLYVTADSHYFVVEGAEGPAPTSGSEAGDLSRFSPAPTESSRCNSPSVSSVSGERRTGRKRNLQDVKNPIYMKPFEFGWKRELVYRSSMDSSSRRMADVYYYTPTNRKVRSAREVLDHVDGVELTIKNFLFAKEPMGLDCSKETIRDARKSFNLRDTPVSKDVREDEEASPPTTKSPEKQKSPKVAETAPTPVEPKSPLGQAANSSPPAAVRKAAALPASTPTRSFPRIKVTPTRMQQQKVGAVGKRSLPRPLLPKPRDQELEMGMLPPLWSAKTVTPAPKKATVSTTWSSTPKGKDHGRKRASSPGDEGPPSKLACMEEDSAVERIHQMQNFVHDVCVMYNVLQHVFQYLKVQELLRAARVCRLWRDLAQHPSLWASVHMKNSKVSDWQGLASTLSARRTTHLDLRKMLLPQRQEDVASMWEQFCEVIGRMDCLERLDLCRCPASVVQHVLTACPNLRTLNATAISCNSISLQDAGGLSNLEELRLKSLSGITLETSLSVLSRLSNLKHLALTTFRNLGQQGVEVVSSLKSLELLELGEVNNLPQSFPTESLARLSNLRRLRLEKVQGIDTLTFNYLETARSLPQLTQLELVNFDVKPGFDTILASCSNIRKLLIIPTYVTQSATTNRMVLGGVLQLSATLQQFVWGVTHELLRVTELFVDQCDVDQVKKEQLKKGDCIPVLKPVPGIAAVHSPSDVWNCEEKYGGPTPSVEILSLPKLHKLLNLQLPQTKVKLLKIPFHATWRQYLSDMHA